MEVGVLRTDAVDRMRYGGESYIIEQVKVGSMIVMDREVTERNERERVTPSGHRHDL
jgi:hypothetical protein